jgi:undecaprenyl-diphosphatase
MAAALALTFLFLLQARWVLAGQSMGFDLGVRDAVHRWASPLTTRMLLGITTLGSGWVLVPLGALIVWQLAAGGRLRQGIEFAAAGLSADVTSQLLKLAFQRPRPAVFFGLPPSETYSFPSGHSFVGCFFYGLLGVVLIGRYPRSRIGIAAGALAIALVIGFSRVYLGYHYPSDVLGGWTCALVWLVLCGPPVHHAHQHRKHRH